MPNATIVIRPATPSDAPAVRALLTGAKLPLDGVPDDLRGFLVATHGAEVVGTIGLEPYGEAALLRSAGVRESERGTGIGEALVTSLLARAKSNGVHTLVLLTTTAERWFPRFGFVEIAREEAPPALYASAEFRGACPATAVVMRRELA